MDKNWLILYYHFEQKKLWFIGNIKIELIYQVAEFEVAFSFRFTFYNHACISNVCAHYMGYTYACMSLLFFDCVIKLDKCKNKTNWLTSVNCYIVVYFFAAHHRYNKYWQKNTETPTDDNKNMSSFFNVSSLAGNVFSTPIGQRIGNFLITLK